MLILQGLKNYLSRVTILVRPERLELSQAKPTRPSTVPVYQFQHGRNNDFYYINRYKCDNNTVTINSILLLFICL